MINKVNTSVTRPRRCFSSLGFGVAQMRRRARVCFDFRLRLCALPRSTRHSLAVAYCSFSLGHLPPLRTTRRHTADTQPSTPAPSLFSTFRPSRETLPLPVHPDLLWIRPCTRTQESAILSLPPGITHDDLLAPASAQKPPSPFSAPSDSNEGAIWPYSAALRPSRCSLTFPTPLTESKASQHRTCDE